MRRSDERDGCDDPVVREYDRLAERYDRRWAFYVQATVGETLERLDARPAERLLDVGCGTGTLIEALRDRTPGLEVTGVDPSREMLVVARRKLGETASLAVGWAECLPFPEETFDAVVSTSVFHYLRRPLAALGEMRRVLKPGGRLVITDWCDDYLTCRILGAWLRLVNRAHFGTYGRRECEELLEAARFEAIEVRRYKISWLWGLMTAKARKGGEAP